MHHVLYRSINNVPHYWNTCGWTRNPRKARIYTDSEARSVHARMSRVGIRAMPVLLSAARAPYSRGPSKVEPVGLQK